MHAIDRHGKLIVKTFNKRFPRNVFGYFWFLHHSLRWFLVVPSKDGFTQSGVFIH